MSDDKPLPPAVRKIIRESWERVRAKDESSLAASAASAGSDSLPEAIYKVDRRTWRYRKAYLAGCLGYLPHFFRAAPKSHWPRVCSSMHRVASACAVSHIAMQDQPDIWNRGALRQKLISWVSDRKPKAPVK
jgi:hypothetical protein